MVVEWYSTGLALGNLTMALMPHDCAPVMVGITTANAKSKYLIVNYSTI
jgi:hypothetical protein